MDDRTNAKAGRVIRALKETGEPPEGMTRDEAMEVPVHFENGRTVEIGDMDGADLRLFAREERARAKTRLAGEFLGGMELGT